MTNHDEPKPDDHQQLGSFLASAAKSLGLASDLGDERQCEPADWWTWSQSRSWVVVAE